MHGVTRGKLTNAARAALEALAIPDGDVAAQSGYGATVNAFDVSVVIAYVNRTIWTSTLVVR